MKKELREWIKELWIPVVAGVIGGSIVGVAINNKQQFRPVVYKGTVRVIEGSTERKRMIDLTPGSEFYGETRDYIVTETD